MKRFKLILILLPVILVVATIIFKSGGYAQSLNRAGVLIQYNPGEIETFCIEFEDNEEITGYDLLEQTGYQIIASFSVMGYVAKTAAKMGAPLIVTLTFPEALPIAQDVIESAYKEEGQLDALDPETVRFISEVTESYTIGVMGLIAREKISTNIVIGAFHSGSVLNILEAGAAVGAMTIGGTARQDSLPFFALFSDYLLMGEENFAAGAMLSGDARHIGSIQGQDWSRFICLALIIGGFILFNLGISIVLDFLSL